MIDRKGGGPQCLAFCERLHLVQGCTVPVGRSQEVPKVGRSVLLKMGDRSVRAIHAEIIGLDRDRPIGPTGPIDVEEKRNFCPLATLYK